MTLERGPDDPELRAVLRRGDPAGDGRALPPHDVARMRRTVLTAAEGRQARVPWLAWAAAAVAVAVVMLAGREMLRGPADVTGHGTAPPTVAKTLEAPPAASPVKPREVPDVVAVRPARPAARRRAGTAARLPSGGEAQRAPLLVQFTTPNGTRVIWKLDPEFKL
ncbi:MAG: hypothetical protein LAO51_04895 [Acidobacteriia bacterium]|nr:hypothetical protein [Terriglobia bacterium]